MYECKVSCRQNGAQTLGSRIFFIFFPILSIKCASTTYMNPFDMLRCEIKFIDKIKKEKKCWTQLSACGTEANYMLGTEANYMLQVLVYMVSSSTSA